MDMIEKLRDEAWDVDDLLTDYIEVHDKIFLHILFPYHQYHLNRMLVHQISRELERAEFYRAAADKNPGHGCHAQ